MDVVFALDSSYNVTRSEFEEQKSFVLTTISAFTISKSQTHVGVITVSETARKDVELTEYSDPDLLRARVSLLQPRKTPASSPTSRLRDMLRKALEIFKAGIRSGVRTRTLLKLLREILSFFRILCLTGRLRNNYSRQAALNLCLLEVI